MAPTQNTHEFIYVVVIRSKHGHAAQLLGNPPGRTRIQPLRRNQNHEHMLLLPECPHCIGNRTQVMFEGAVRLRPRIVKVNRAVMTVLVSPS